MTTTPTGTPTPTRYPVEVHHNTLSGGWTSWGRDSDGRAQWRGHHDTYRDAQAFADRENRASFPHLVVDPDVPLSPQPSQLPTTETLSGADVADAAKAPAFSRLHGVLDAMWRDGEARGIDPFEPAWDAPTRGRDTDAGTLTMADHLASESGEGKE